MSQTTVQLRRLWQEFECAAGAMVVIPFGPDRIRVAPPAAEAFEALAAVLLHHDYEIRTEDTDSYSCRPITDGKGKSLHAYGIALDVNWKTNPFMKHETPRKVRFSDKETQALRGLDVRHGHADTDMTPAMIADVMAIKTRQGTRVFDWGGNWSDRKDCMHFELDLSPAELAAGLDPDSIAGLAEYIALLDGHAPTPPPAPAPEPVPEPLPTDADLYEVIARKGLRVRSLPSVDSEIKRSLPARTRVFVLSRADGWAKVDLQGDGLADGFMSLEYLRQVDSSAPGAVLPPAPGGAHGGRADITGEVTPEIVSRMFPSTRKTDIARHLSSVLDGLHVEGLGDRDMVLMALATIRAESEGFLPISEGRSHYNTRHAPFDRYEPGTSAGRSLGNTQPGDGARFKGRGFVQLTGRDNYGRVGRQIGVDLLANPELANDDRIAGRILAQYLRNCETRLRAALAANDLETARRCVNGGTHGMSRFRDAWERGVRVLP